MARTGHEFSYRRAGSAAAAMTLSVRSSGALAAPACCTCRASHWLFHRMPEPNALRRCDRQSSRCPAYALTPICGSNFGAWRQHGQPCKSDSADRYFSAQPGRCDRAQWPASARCHCAVEPRLGAKTVVFKLGAEGVLVSHQGVRSHIPALRVQAIDATGAGDCFAGNLLARMSLGRQRAPGRALCQRRRRACCAGLWRGSTSASAGGRGDIACVQPTLAKMWRP